MTFQVLCCIMVLLAVSAPSRTALRRIGFALILDLTIFSQYNNKDVLIYLIVTKIIIPKNSS